MQHDNPWQTVQSNSVYQDEWISVRRDEVIRPDNQPGSYTYIESSDSVLVVALNSAQQIYLEWTYRYPTKSWGWELPGGGIMDEEPLAAAKRELSEEIGYNAEKWELLGSPKVHNGIMAASVHVYVAQNISLSGVKASDDSETTNTGRFFSMSDLESMILKSEIIDSQIIGALYLYNLSQSSKLT